MLLPTSLGERKLPSMNWPAAKIAMMISTLLQSGQNCTSPTPIAMTPPMSAPM